MKTTLKTSRKIKVRKNLPSNLTCSRVETPRNVYQRHNKFRKNNFDFSDLA